MIGETISSCWEDYKDYIKIHPSVIIDPCATIKIFTLPDPPEVCLEIDEGSHIFSNFNILRPQAKIKIGKRCQIGVVNFLCAESIEVGDDVLMAWGITLMDNDSHSLDWEKRKNDVAQGYEDYMENKNNFIKNKDWSSVKMLPIVIGDKNWIGFNSSILKGVSTGEDVVIGACSVVTKSFNSKLIIAGNPTKVIDKLG